MVPPHANATHAASVDLPLSATHQTFGPDFFEMAMDLNPNMIFVKDHNLRFLYANRALRSLFHPDEQERIIGFTRAEDFAPEERDLFLREDRLALEKGHSEIVEEITDYLGHTFTFLTRKTRIHNHRGEPCVMGMSTNITELSKRERALVESNKMLEHFAAIAAHDLRSPLCTFIDCGEVIARDRNTRLSEQAADMLRLMQDSARSLTQHVSLLLDAYKGEGSAQRQMHDFNMILEQVKFGLKHTIERSGARIYANRLPSLRVNGVRMRQLLHNLIENSIKYRGEAIPLVIVRHEWRDGMAHFSVEDNGIGIPLDEREAVFDLGAQVAQATDSTGIGLALCRQIVEEHGGRIWADSDAPLGCRICFTLPHLGN